MEFLNYEFFRFIWWILIIVLWVGFAITEGFDMGGAMLIRFVGKTDDERRVAINVLAPHWDGNQVWFILAAGALFAAWPLLYAVAFSSLYTALLIVLFSLFWRPLAFDYRSKLENQTWRNFWDWALFFPGIIPPLVMGIAIGNLFLGIPFEYDQYLRSTFDGGLFTLFHPFAVIAGLMAVTLFATQGATYFMLRTENAVYDRSRTFASFFALATAGLFIVGGLLLYFTVDGHVVTSAINTAGPSNPTLKTVELVSGGWFANYSHYPLTLLAPISAFIGMIIAFLMAKAGKAAFAFWGSSLSIIGVLATVSAALFPFIMPSSKNPSHGLTMWDGTSSELTLHVMFWCAVFFVPLIIAYTAWCYKSLWGKFNTDIIRENDHSLY